MTSGEERLELNRPDFGIRAEAFFRLMNLPEFRNEFLANPSGVVARELQLTDVQPQDIDTRNQMVYQLLLDPAFNSWAAEFQERIEREFPPLREVTAVDEIVQFVRAKENRDRLMAEFSESVVRHLRPDSYQELLAAGIEHAPLHRAEPDIAVVPLTFIAVIVVVVVALAQGRPVDMISRLSVQSTINQLNPDQIQIIQRAAQGRQ